MFEPLPGDVAWAIDAARDRLGAYARVHYRGEVDSTNDDAIALAEAGAPEGTSVTADMQRRGRGRRGRDWHSPPGAGLYVSTVVRPRTDPGDMPLVTLAAGIAAATAIRAITALPVELKWPNDVVIGRPWRKLGGILCEGVGPGARLDAVVVGVGLNLRAAAYPPDLADRATSIETELGRPVDRSAILIAVLEALRLAMADVHARRHDALGNAWRALGLAGLGGCGVRWQDGARERRGRARDIDRDGALLVDVDGGVERVIAGEVLWDGLSRE